MALILARPKRPVRWGLLEIVLVYLGILAGGIIFELSGDRLVNFFVQIGIPETQLGYFPVVYALQFIFTVLLVIIFTVLLNKASMADLGIRGASREDFFKYGILGGLFLMLLMIILGIPINYLQPDIQPQLFEKMLRSISGTGGFIILLVIGAVLAPLSEELFYRGMIYPVFRRHLGPLWGAIIAGIVFGLAHWDLWRTIPLAVGGAILCYIYEKTGSIFVSAVAHGVWNGVMSIIVYFSIVNL